MSLTKTILIAVASLSLLGLLVIVTILVMASSVLISMPLVVSGLTFIRLEEGN